MNKKPSRLFAIIPAAGHSRRMGQPKLLLSLGNKTVIDRVLAALTLPEIITRCIVVRNQDEDLRSVAEAEGGWCVSPPVDPVDMRQSVQFAIQEIRRRYSPDPQDGWILAPADHPVLNASLVIELLTQWKAQSPLILVPEFQGRSGHPTIFRWSLVDELENLPQNVGVNFLMKSHLADVAKIVVEDEAAICDLDTPEDYERLLRCHRAG